MRGSSYPETLVQMEGRPSLPTQGQVRSFPKELSIAPRTCSVLSSHPFCQASVTLTMTVPGVVQVRICTAATGTDLSRVS